MQVDSLPGEPQALIKQKEVCIKKKKDTVRTLDNLSKCGEFRIELRESKDLIEERKSPVERESVGPKLTCALNEETSFSCRI